MKSRLLVWLATAIGIIAAPILAAYLKIRDFIVKPKTKSWIIVGIVLFITFVPMLVGNYLAKDKGPLDDCLLNKNDPFYKMDQQAEQLSNQGLRTGDAVNFVLPFTGKEGKLVKKDLIFIYDFYQELKARFPGYGVLSLTNIAKYRNLGDELTADPYLSEAVVKEIKENPDWDINAWKEGLTQDKGIEKLLIGGDFQCAFVKLLLPRGYNETETHRKIVEFLEQRKINKLEWFKETDIGLAPQFMRKAESGKVIEGVYPLGWVIGRGLMTSGMLSDILFLSTIGLTIVAIAFFLSFISLRQAGIATIIVLLSFAWTRGSVGLLQIVGVGFYERVYFILIYTALIVSGISFAERKFATYNSVKERNNNLAREIAWKRTKPVNQLIFVTALISILNFLSLYQIRVRPVLEVGIFSALGISYLYLLVVYFLPAVHQLIGGEKPVASFNKWQKPGVKWNNFLKAIVGKCFNSLNLESGYQQTSRKALVLTLVCLFGALIFIAHDASQERDEFHYIESKTNPLGYLTNTIVYRGYGYLKSIGCGFDYLSVAVYPEGDNQGALEDPAFIANVDKLQQTLVNLPFAMTTHSILDSIKIISRELYQTELPQNQQQLHDIFLQLDWNLGPRVKEQLWFDKGIVIFISNMMDDSSNMAKLNAAVVELGSKFPSLQVIPFGKPALYPRADDYVIKGKPLNAVNGYWQVVLICAIWIWYRNRRLRNSLKLLGIRTGFAISAPFIFAGTIIILVMAIFRVPLDQSNACNTALAVNAAIDFSLYLVADFQSALIKNKSINEALYYALVIEGKIIVVDIFLNTLCFAPLLFSNFEPIMKIGGIMIVMMLACGFGALVILPAFLPWCVKKTN